MVPRTEDRTGGRTGTADRPTRVVVGYDGSSSADEALAAGIEQARETGAPLHVLSAVETPDRAPASETAYRRASVEAVTRALDRAAAVLGENRVTSVVEPGSPSAVLLAHTEPQDLLVVGSHGHRPVARMLLGSTSTAVAAHARCPVLVVRGPRMRSRGPVVVGVDGSPASSVAVACAARVAEREGATLRAVMALSPVTDALGFVSGPEDPEITQAQALLSEAVARVPLEHPGLHLEQVLTQTHPVEALLRHSRGARLVVVGTRGLGGIEAMLLGSVSREVLHHASCPVLVVRGATTSGDAGGSPTVLAATA